MKFTVPGPQVKLLGKVIHSLSKLGDEIYLEPSRDSLSLRAVNSSRSAYATFTFSSSFFSGIEQSRGTVQGGEDARCKVMVRSLLLAFRSLSVLEKTVEWCSLETGGQEDKLLVTLNCRHSVSKSFRVHLVECEAVRAVYTTEGSTNTWCVQARVLQEANGNFLASQEEVTMHVAENTFKMNNFSEECADEKKLVHTELSMQPGEFEAYTIGQPTSLTFCLKELKSLIGFCESLQLPITASFTEGGAPLILTSASSGVSAVYVLATLAEPGAPAPRVANTPALRKQQQGAARAAAVPPAPPLFLDTSAASLAPPGRINSTQAGAVGMDSLSLSAIHEPGRGGDTEEQELDCPGEPDTVTATPPAKRKKRQMFQRCFEKTFNPSTVAGSERVLAPDSDEDQ